MAIITLTGPTCAGKSTLERVLQQMGCGRAISHTTRAPRAGEVDGEHYHFVTEEQFQVAASTGAFVEQVELGALRYGMSRDAIRAAQTVAKHTAIVVDPHGAAQIRSFARLEGIAVAPVWIDCSLKEQAKRFIARLAGDMLIGKDAIGPYTERLQLMLGDEVRWRKDAFKDLGGDYAMHLRSDGSESVEELATKVLRIAELADLLADKSTPFNIDPLMY
jgi:guanylate kinase